MLIIIIGIVFYSGYLLMIQQTVIEDGDVFAGTVRIEDEKYNEVFECSRIWMH